MIFLNIGIQSKIDSIKAIKQQPVPIIVLILLFFNIIVITNNITKIIIEIIILIGFLVSFAGTLILQIDNFMLII